MRRWYIKIVRFLVGTRRRQYATLGVLGLLIVGLLLWHHARAQPSGAELVAELSSVMVVPDEQPQIALVVNAASLQGQQPFYAGVENGDVLFLFPQSGKAVLFRPRTHQVVNAGPFNVQSSPSK